MPRLKPNDVPLTPEENARIKAAIADDPDTFELDDDWFARARPAREVAPELVEQYRRYRAAQAGHEYLIGNALVCGDNLDVLRGLPDDCVDLIYLDPPFNSNQFYVAAFGDKGMVPAQLRDAWRWTEGTEKAFQRLPHGRLLDCLRGIILQTGEQSPDGRLLRLYGAPPGRNAACAETRRQHLPALRPPRQRLPAYPDGRHLWRKSVSE